MVRAQSQPKDQHLWRHRGRAWAALGDPVFEPILEMLNRRRAVVHVHPTLNPLMKQLDILVPGYVLEYVFDTTRAAASLMFSGALDRFPDIRFILSHAGGTLPFVSWRVANVARDSDGTCGFRCCNTVDLAAPGRTVDS